MKNNIQNEFTILDTLWNGQSYELAYIHRKNTVVE